MRFAISSPMSMFRDVLGWFSEQEFLSYNGGGGGEGDLIVDNITFEF